MVISLFVLAMILFAAFATSQNIPSEVSGEKQPFLVGVTFCGDNVQDAKLLVDRVKNYTNLFVLQSGPLIVNGDAVFEIGDYAVSKGLHFAAYFSDHAISDRASWVSTVEKRWDSMFAGLYYDDEPGGKMLDAQVTFTPTGSISNVSINGVGFERVIKNAGGDIRLSREDEFIVYQPDGEIGVIKRKDSSIGGGFSNVTSYYPDGTITFQVIDGDFFTMANGTEIIAQLDSYETVLAGHPFPDSESVANAFLTLHRGRLEHLAEELLPERSFPVFTSDYAFHWYDYLAGYDVVLAEFGWNNSVSQEIGFVRGAANLQSKGWGAMITWTYTHPPYLASGQVIFDQMKSAYEAGADYVVVFNYAKDMASPYGILLDEHFDSLERFWNEVVQNPEVSNNGRGNFAFVLPMNCGWSMRNADDLEWGFRLPGDEVQRVFSRLDSVLAKHNMQLDIIYDDPSYPFEGRYSQVYFWNQSG